MWVGPATKWTHPIKCEKVPLQKWILSHQMWVCSANKWNLQSGFYLALRVFISGTLRWKNLKRWLGKLYKHESRWQAIWQPADSQRTWPAGNSRHLSWQLNWWLLRLHPKGKSWSFAYIRINFWSSSTLSRNAFTLCIVHCTVYNLCTYLLINAMPEEKYIYVGIIPTKASFLLILDIISSYFPNYAMLDLWKSGNREGKRARAALEAGEGRTSTTQRKRRSWGRISPWE